MKTGKVKKILDILVNVLIYVFLAICIVSVFLVLLAPKSDDGATEIFGYQLRLVETNSMGRGEDTSVLKYDIKSIPKGSVVFIETVPDDEAEAAKWYANEIKVGDVLTFKYFYTGKQVVITHRVVDKYLDPEGRGYVIVLEGDNKSAGTEVLQQTIYTGGNGDEKPFDYVIGKVRGNSYVLGVFIGAMKEPLSLLLLIILPCLAIIISEIVRIVKTLNEEKREKEREEKAKKDEEILELKKQLEELRKKDLPIDGDENVQIDNANDSPSAEDTTPQG